MKKAFLFLPILFLLTNLSMAQSNTNKLKESLFYIYGEDCNCTPFDTKKRFQAGYKSYEHNGVLTIYSNLADCNKITAFNLLGQKFQFKIDSVSTKRDMAILYPVGGKYEKEVFQNILGLNSTAKISKQSVLMIHPKSIKTDEDEQFVLYDSVSHKPWKKLKWTECKLKDYYNESFTKLLDTLNYRYKLYGDIKLKIINQNYTIRDKILKGIENNNYIDTTCNYVVFNEPTNVNILNGSPLILYNDILGYQVWGLLNIEGRFENTHVSDKSKNVSEIKDKLAYIAPISGNKYLHETKVNNNYRNFNSLYYPPINKSNGFYPFSTGNQIIHKAFDHLIYNEWYALNKIFKDKLNKEEVKENYPLSFSMVIAQSQLIKEEIDPLFYDEAIELQNIYNTYLLDTNKLINQFKKEYNVLGTYGFNLKDIEKVIFLFNLNNIIVSHRELITLFGYIDLNTISVDSLINIHEKIISERRIIENLKRYNTYSLYSTEGLKMLYSNIKVLQQSYDSNAKTKEKISKELKEYYSNQLLFALTNNDEYSKKIRSDYLTNKRTIIGKIIETDFSHYLNVLKVEHLYDSINNIIIKRCNSLYRTANNLYCRANSAFNSINVEYENTLRSLIVTEHEGANNNKNPKGIITDSFINNVCNLVDLTVSKLNNCELLCDISPINYREQSIVDSIISLKNKINSLSNNIKVINYQYKIEIEKRNFLNAKIPVYEVTNSMYEELGERGLNDPKDLFSLSIKRINDFGSDVKIDFNVNKPKNIKRSSTDIVSSLAGFRVGDELDLNSFYIVQALKTVLLDTLHCDSISIKIKGLADGIPYKSKYNTAKVEHLFEHNLGKIDWNNALSVSQSDFDADESNIYLSYARAYFAEHCLRFNRFDFNNPLTPRVSNDKKSFLYHLNNFNIEKIPVAVSMQNHNGAHRGFSIEIIAYNYYDCKKLEPPSIDKLFLEEYTQIKYDSIIINSKSENKSIALMVGLQDGFSEGRNFGVYDAISMNKLFKEKLKYAQCHTFLGHYKSLGGTATTDTLIYTLKGIEKQKNLDEFVFYFSGSIKNKNTMALLNGNLPVRKLFSFIKKIDAKRKIIIFDNAYIDFNQLESPQHSSSYKMGNITCNFKPEPYKDSSYLVISLKSKLPILNEKRSYLCYNILKLFYETGNSNKKQLYFNDLINIWDPKRITNIHSHFNGKQVFQKFN